LGHARGRARALDHPVVADRDAAILALLRHRAASRQRGDAAAVAADEATLMRLALPPIVPSANAGSAGR
jgi:hypothetical protein